MLALDSLGLPADHAVVVEDSRNGLLAATGAGLTCMITVNYYTADEDFSEAALVVSSLGSAYTPDFGVIMVATVLATIPTLIVFFAMQRQFVQGMLGSVK